MNLAARIDPTSQYDEDVTRFRVPEATAGTVLFLEILDPAIPRGRSAISELEQNQLESLAALAQAQVISRPAGQMSVYIADPVRAMDLAAHLLDLITDWRNLSPGRSGLMARVVAGFGPVTLTRGQGDDDWCCALPRLARHVPANSVGLLPDLYKIVHDMLHSEATPVALDGQFADALHLGRLAPSDQERCNDPDSAIIDPGAVHSLQLTLHGQSLTIEPDDCPVDLGRDADCKLPLQDHQVSRRHARIEYRNNRFHLFDTSRNGSYVRNRGGRNVLIRDDGLILHGQGAISLGSPVRDAAPELIRFSCDI